MHALIRKKKVINPLVYCGALYYALIVSLLFTIISATFLMAAQIVTLRFANIDREQKVSRNLQSAINIALGDTGTAPLGVSTTLDLFGKGTDSVRIYRERWGLFELARIEAFTGTESQSRHCLIGTTVAMDSRLAIYLQDRNRPLYLAGETTIKGNCFLPEAGIKPAYIAAGGAKGKASVEGEVSKASDQLPRVISTGTGPENLFGLLGQHRTGTHSDLPPTSITKAPFSENAVVYLEAGGEISPVWQGHMAVISDAPISIAKNSIINDAIVFAPSIHFQEGFSGSGQFFATDSIVLERNVNLMYPSVAMALRTRPNGNILLRVGTGSVVQGAMALIDTMPGNIAENSMIIGTAARVDGLVYCNGALDLKGKVTGSVFSGMFKLETQSATYENHLLNAEINAVELHEHFAFPSFISLPGKRTIAKWL